MEKGEVVLVACPLEGHLTPMLQLGTLLHSKGFSITIAHTQFNAPNPSNYPDFTFVQLADNLGGRDTSFYNLLAVIPAMNHSCREPMMKFLSENREGRRVSCVIYDPIMYYMDSVAKDLKIPSLIFRTNSAAYFQALGVNLRLHDEMSGLLPEAQLLEPVPGLDHLRYRDLPLPLHIMLPEMVPKLEAQMSGTRSSPVAIILNTTDDLEDSVLSKLKQHYQIPFFALGPLHKMVSFASTTTTPLEKDKSCIDWLNRQESSSVVYISLGSLAILESKDVVEIAWGLANSNQPFLWVVRPGSISGSKWIEALPEDFQERVGERGLIVKWAPQKEVLAHSSIGAFWSHCGWNSTLESICEGVPLICRPCFADQRVTARYLTYVWKVAFALEDPLDREAIEKSIRRVVVDDEGKDLKMNVLKLKEKLESSVMEGGNSSSSLKNMAEFITSL